MNFKVGDKVERVAGASGEMRKGDIGTISKIVDEYWIELEEYPGERHNANRFILSLKDIGVDEMASRINEAISNIKELDSDRELNDAKRMVDTIRLDIKRYNNHLADLWKRYKEYMRKVVAFSSLGKRDYTSDIKAILEHKYVEKIKVGSGSSYMVYTDYIDIYDEEGNKFRGNKYNLIFDFSDMTCYIHGLDDDYNRKSYWTCEDPHPHVDGSTGEACWGSAGSMLTENMNEGELYASFIVVLNFLQQVNTSDPAGKHIGNWDCIDEEGNDIDNPYESTIVECAICDYEMDEEDATTCEECGDRVCSDHYYYIDSEQVYVCESCYEEKYTMCDECDIRLSNSDAYHHDDYTYCEECYNENIKECYECGCNFKEDEVIYCGDEYYCSECFDEKFTDCENCGDTVERRETFHCNTCGQDFCENCEGEPIPGMCQQCYDEQEEGEEE